MPDLDRTKLEAGPARVTFDNVALGYLGDGLVLQIDTTITALHGSEAGTTELDNIVSGGMVHMEVPLAEISVTKMAKGIINSTLTGGRLDFKNNIGLSVRSLAKELRITKIKGGVLSTSPDDIFVFPEASPGPSQVKIPFHPTQQRLVVVTFKVWMNDDTKIWGYVGI